MPKRFEMTLKITGDLDGLKGWGYNENDWQALAFDALLRQSHYNVEVEVIGCSDVRGEMGGWLDHRQGWNEDVQLLRSMDQSRKIQFRTGTRHHHFEWVAIEDLELDHELRQFGKDAYITAFRLPEGEKP